MRLLIGWTGMGVVLALAAGGLGSRALAANTGDSSRITGTLLTPTVPIGGPVTITWSIVPDGTRMPTFAAVESNPVSNLIARFDALQNVPAGERNPDDLTLRPWFITLRDTLAIYSSKTGITYIYVHDSDSTSSFGAGPLANKRGDIRIGGISLSGVLGYNGFPASGSDMVLNTAGTTFSSLSTLRFIFGHEHAHGLGLGHVKVNGNCNLSVVCGSGGNSNGAQFDDLLPLQRKYGDVYEKNGGNNTQANAVSLGTLTAGAVAKVGSDAKAVSVAAAAVDFVSTANNTDKDWYRFALTSAQPVNLVLAPKGPAYTFLPEGGTDQMLDAADQSDLVLKLYNAAGTLVRSQDATGSGAAESILGQSLAAGTYGVEVSGKTNAAQMYELQAWYGNVDSDGDGLPDSQEPPGDVDGDGIENVNDPDSDGDATWDGREVADGRLPFDVRDLGFRFDRAGDAEDWKGVNLTGALTVAGGSVSAASGNDPQMTRAGFFFPGSVMRALFVRMRASVAGGATFFWSHNGTGGAGFSATRQLVVNYTGPNTDKVLYFDFAADPGWTGRTITNLRFDPPGSAGNTFSVNEIRGSDGDLDDDGVPDLIDGTEDSDGDGLLDLEDPDSDDDGMPDGFEFQYGLSRTTPDADLDRDGDGRSNLDEYIAGTDPTNARDALTAAIAAAPAGQFRVTVEGKAGRSYQLFRLNAAGTDWLGVGPPVGPLGTAQGVALTDGAPPVPQGIYRVRVVLP